jgi:putative ABC transport system permease protein
MPTSKSSMGDRLYAGLLRLLPFDFRSEFGSEMEEVFREQRAETGRDRGVAGLLKVWGATIADIFRMAPREHLAVLAQDTRYALRMMRRNPGYTAATVIILGLGIGVNTSVFSAVYSVLLKPLPYTQGDDLVVLRQPATKQGTDNIRFSPLEVEDYRKQNQSLEGVVEHHSMTFTLFGANEAHRVLTGVVSAGFFDLFGVKPLLGRTFNANDERPDSQPVLVLSYEFWRKTEGGDPHIVGRVYQMNDRPHIVIGVLPPIPQYPNENDVYMTTVACPFRSNPRNIANRKFRLISSVFGRLKPNVPLEFCRKDLAGIAQHFQQDYPAVYPATLGFGSAATTLREDLTRKAKPMLLVLLGAAAFVLLIACANVANLMLARMGRREQELVIRTAVGAGSGRLLRQLLTEGFLMAMAAAGIGLLFAAATNTWLTQLAGQFTPRAREIGIDGWALAFAILCASATTMVFGSLAAINCRRDVGASLKEGGRATGDRRRNVARSVLIAAQVAFSFVLLTGAGLMVRSFVELQRVDTGVVTQRVFAAAFDLNWSKYKTNEQFLDVSSRLLEKVQMQPGVEAAAVASSFPMDPDLQAFGGRPARLMVQGDPQSEADSLAVRSIRNVTPDYFKTLGIPLVAGRTFRDSDVRASQFVTVINHSLAVRRWGRENPIGRRISVDGGDSWAEIIGIVADVKEFGPERDTPYQMYAAMAQSPNPGAILVRSVADPNTVSGLLRRAIVEVDPQTAITNFETLEQAKADAVASPRTLTRLFSIFGGLAFVIAIAGITSMLALWVRQRKREIGIRMALGASPRAIVRDVLRQGMVLVVIGLGAGLAGALELTRWLKALLFQVQPTDIPTYVAVSAILLAAALVACLVPARSASNIDPQTALRSE